MLSLSMHPVITSYSIHYTKLYESAMEKKTVAVVFGGQSSEHEVSRVSAQSVLENINREKFNVKMFGITKEGRWLEYSGDITKIGSGDRITSYNVCYTKLLRIV